MKRIWHQTHNFFRKKLAKPFAVVFFTVTFFFILYHFFYAQRIIPGVKIGNLKMGGKTSSQAYEALRKELSEKDLLLNFTYEGKEFDLTSSDIDLNYEVKETVEKLFNLGRTGSFIVDSKDKLAAFVKGIRLPPIYYYNDNKLGQFISSIEGTVNIQSEEPTFVLANNGELIITKASEGKKLLNSKILNSIDNFSSQSYKLPVKRVVPKNGEADLLLVKSEVERIIGSSPRVKFEDKVWTFSKQDILSMLSYKKEDGKVVVGTDKTALNKLSGDLSEEVDVEPRGEVFRTDGERVVEFRPKSDGRSMDKEQFKKDFSKALKSDVKEVVLLVNPSKAPSDTNKYGIYALLGEGVSYFSGSIPGRIKNLTLAAGRSSGVLVATGDTYSFNKSVGEISYKTGYDQAYIIENGRTVLGEGGGVCQVSTTLFRAVLNAGLPIVKRTAHAYRVHYYEENSDVGLDATVFSPSVDFQFRNDTPGYLLVQADWDLDKVMLRFKIYGTPDGRTVELTKPVVTNVVAPPEVVYEDDPTLQKGKVVQVDWAAWGANVSFERTVKKGEEVLYKDTFVSRYQPWRAVYKKGTKEKLVLGEFNPHY